MSAGSLDTKRGAKYESLQSGSGLMLMDLPNEKETKVFEENERKKNINEIYKKQATEMNEYNRRDNRFLKTIVS